MLTIDHMLVECADLQETRGENYTTDYVKTLFEKIPEICIVEFLRAARFLWYEWSTTPCN